MSSSYLSSDNEQSYAQPMSLKSQTVQGNLNSQVYTKSNQPDMDFLKKIMKTTLGENCGHLINEPDEGFDENRDYHKDVDNRTNQRPMFKPNFDSVNYIQNTGTPHFSKYSVNQATYLNPRASLPLKDIMSTMPYHNEIDHLAMTERYSEEELMNLSFLNHLNYLNTLQGCDYDNDIGGMEEEEDASSVASEGGSELLQLLHQSLDVFNNEVRCDENVVGKRYRKPSGSQTGQSSRYCSSGDVGGGLIRQRYESGSKKMANLASQFEMYAKLAQAHSLGDKQEMLDQQTLRNRRYQISTTLKVRNSPIVCLPPRFPKTSNAFPGFREERALPITSLTPKNGCLFSNGISSTTNTSLNRGTESGAFHGFGQTTNSSSAPPIALSNLNMPSTLDYNYPSSGSLSSVLCTADTTDNWQQIKQCNKQENKYSFLQRHNERFDSGSYCDQSSYHCFADLLPVTDFTTITTTPMPVSLQHATKLPSSILKPSPSSSNAATSRTILISTLSPEKNITPSKTRRSWGKEKNALPAPIINRLVKKLPELIKNNLTETSTSKVDSPVMPQLNENTGLKPTKYSPSSSDYEVKEDFTVPDKYTKQQKKSISSKAALVNNRYEQLISAPVRHHKVYPTILQNKFQIQQISRDSCHYNNFDFCLPPIETDHDAHHQQQSMCSPTTESSPIKNNSTPDNTADHDWLERVTNRGKSVPIHMRPPLTEVAAKSRELEKRINQHSPIFGGKHQLKRPEKWRRACSFYLRGHCKKEDCEFAHDLNRVTCRFWEAGECFKGTTCPFLHGYLPENIDIHDDSLLKPSLSLKPSANNSPSIASN